MSLQTASASSDLANICRILNTVVKIDTRFIDRDGNVAFQLVRHQIPSVLPYQDRDFRVMGSRLQENTGYAFEHYTDPHGLEYVSSAIWKQGDYHGLVVLGPFLSSASDAEFINKMIADNTLPISQRSQLINFYKALPFVSANEYKAIGELLVNMLLREPIPARHISANAKKKDYRGTTQRPKADPRTIEFRYEQEKQLMHAISSGEAERVFNLLSSNGEKDIMDLSSRVPENPIRSSKNLALILSVLCRLAAERGGVHPIYVHHLSERFALLIERASTLQQLMAIRRSMIQEYCDAVREYSTQRFSPLVKKAVQYIRFHLEAPLTLQHIADSIGANPVYLSRIFKEDTGVSIIDYIHRERVEEAKLHLRNAQATITDIAFLVGFNDVNYFGRIFKRITSLTPSQYKNGVESTSGAPSTST